MPHTNFPKVAWVIFVKVDPVVVLASSIPEAAWVLAVLTNAAVAVAHVAPEFPGLPQSGWHGGCRKERGWLMKSLQSVLLTAEPSFQPPKLYS